ncbi:UNVERIFIED_CONTAM: hypothetical protein Sradi_3272300 [Sesamum radiatum]|uniref:Uncharacterized protein n=1 Tax=Sesamum radiatum TaxID=300843 RepID=A0AAW2R0I4_SESRA
MENPVILTNQVVINRSNPVSYYTLELAGGFEFEKCFLFGLSDKINAKCGAKSFFPIVVSRSKRRSQAVTLLKAPSLSFFSRDNSFSRCFMVVSK